MSPLVSRNPRVYSSFGSDSGALMIPSYDSVSARGPAGDATRYALRGTRDERSRPSSRSAPAMGISVTGGSARVIASAALSTNVRGPGEEAPGHVTSSVAVSR